MPWFRRKILIHPVLLPLSLGEALLSTIFAGHDILEDPAVRGDPNLAPCLERAPAKGGTKIRALNGLCIDARLQSFPFHDYWDRASLLLHPHDKRTKVTFKHPQTGHEINLQCYSPEHKLGQTRHHHPLKEALQRPGPHRRVVTAAHDGTSGAIIHRSSDLLLLEARRVLLELDLEDGGQLGLCEGGEHGDLVDPVEELGREDALDDAHDIAPDLLAERRCA